MRTTEKSDTPSTTGKSNESARAFATYRGSRPGACGPQSSPRGGARPSSPANPSRRAAASRRARAMTGPPSGPVVGYRIWRMHRARLWPARYSARRPWPLGDAQGVCEAWESSTDSRCHQAPGPSGTCPCGLYAYHEMESVMKQDLGDVWGAVVGWGAVEVHADGFRSEWQRPIVLAVPRQRRGTRRGAPRGRTAPWRARRAADRVGTVAREHGDPIPAELVPVTLLSLFTEERAWASWNARVDWGDLARAVRAGSVIARREMAAHAVDLAAAAAARVGSAGDGDLQTLEMAVLGLLAAVETWIPPARHMSQGLAGRHFRSYAASWMKAALEQGRSGSDLIPPTTVTYGEVRELAEKMSRPRHGLRPAPARSREPLPEKRILGLARQLSTRPQSDFLVDGLWRCLHDLSLDLNDCPSWGSRLARARALQRRHARQRRGVNARSAKRRGRRQRKLMRRVADDRRVHSFLRARALERLARGASLESAIEFLEHPLADTRAAARTLARHAESGRAQARVILTQPLVTDAQLCACLYALESLAVGAAEERIEARPAPERNLLLACVRVLSPARAAEIVCRRISTGEALANPDWLGMVSEVDREEQEAAVRAFLERASDVRSVFDARLCPLGALDVARRIRLLPTIGPLIREAARNDRELDAQDRDWILVDANW